MIQEFLKINPQYYQIQNLLIFCMSRIAGAQMLDKPSEAKGKSLSKTQRTKLEKTQHRMTSIPKKNVMPKFEDKLANGMKILELLQIYED